jgi:hypothetical protein
MYSSNINVITSTIWEAEVFVLLMGGIYDLCLEMGSGRRHTYDILMIIGSGIQIILKL